MAADRAETLFRRVAGGEGGPFWLAGLRGLARAASWPYGLAAGVKNNLYDLGLLRPRRLPAPVIGVGNITVGGTGKTPVVMEVAAALGRMGLPAGIISRGYGRQGEGSIRWVSRGGGLLAGFAEAGDEPMLLARRLKVPVAVGADRWAVGKEMLASCGSRVLLCDDLFQHRRLHRDLDLLCLDAAQPLGNGALLPRGPLREPAAGMRRAQVVVLTRAGDARQTERARRWLRNFWGPGPVLACWHKIDCLVDRAGREINSHELAGRPVVAFCGLARPRAFAGGLSELGLTVLELKAFADHHPFTGQEIADLWSLARARGAEALICSEKDEVRLPSLPEEVRIWTTRLWLEFIGGPAALEGALAWGLKDWGLSK